MGAPPKQKRRTTEPPLPQSVAAEAALLGSILFEPAQMLKIDEIVKPADFYVPANRAVAQVLWHRWQNNKPIDAALVYEDLVKRKQNELIGGHEGLMRLADAVPEASHAEHYARIVSDKAQLRILIGAAQQVLMMSMTPTEETSDVLSRAELVMGKALQQRVIKGAVKFTEQFPKELNILTALDEFAAVAPGVSTGFADLDDLTTGLHPGELAIIAGRPSMGKTSFALKAALHMALENKKAVLIFSLETSASQITRNLMSIHTQTSAHKMRSLSLSKQEKVQLAIRSARLIDCNVTIDEQADKLNRIQAACRHFALKNPLGLVIVDYLQLLGQEIKFKREELEHISRSLKRLAKELAVPFLVVSQLSRAVEHRGQKITKKSATKYFRVGETVYMPRLSDLRESGAIEQDADAVLLLYRQDYYRHDKRDYDNVAHLRVAKQRHGPTGRIKLTFLPEFLMFGDYIAEDEYDDGGEGSGDSTETFEEDSCAETREQERQGSLPEGGREKAGMAEGSDEEDVPF